MVILRVWQLLITVASLSGAKRSNQSITSTLNSLLLVCTETAALSLDGMVFEIRSRDGQAKQTFHWSAEVAKHSVKCLRLPMKLSTRHVRQRRFCSVEIYLYKYMKLKTFRAVND